MSDLNRAAARRDGRSVDGFHAQPVQAGNSPDNICNRVRRADFVKMNLFNFAAVRSRFRLGNEFKNANDFRFDFVRQSHSIQNHRANVRHGSMTMRMMMVMVMMFVIVMVIISMFMVMTVVVVMAVVMIMMVVIMMMLMAMIMIVVMMIVVVVMMMIVVVMHNKVSFGLLCFLNYILWPGHCQNIYFSVYIPPPGLHNRQKASIMS